MSSFSGEHYTSITGEQLLSLPFVEERFVLEGLFPLGNRRLTTLNSVPFDGKSTLAWQATVTATKGGEFLGRKMIRCGVLYCCSEEERPDIARILRRLGYNPDTDAKLIILDLRDVADKLAEIAKHLEANPEIGLVVFETLDDILEMPDLNSNSDCRRRFKAMDKALGKFYHRIAILALHHLKKKQIDSLGSRMLGGTVVRGRCFGTWFLKQNSDTDTRRIFSAVVRSGRPIPPTFLNYDEATGISTLGRSLQEDRKVRVENTKGRILTDIQRELQKQPDATRDEILSRIQGNSDDVKDVFDSAVRGCAISRTGKGRKGSPFRHRWIGIAQEMAA